MRSNFLPAKAVAMMNWSKKPLSKGALLNEKREDILLTRLVVREGHENNGSSQLSPETLKYTLAFINKNESIHH